MDLHRLREHRVKVLEEIASDATNIREEKVVVRRHHTTVWIRIPYTFA